MALEDSGMAARLNAYWPDVLRGYSMMCSVDAPAPRPPALAMFERKVAVPIAVCALLVAAVSGCAGNVRSTGPVDVSVTREVDVTGDGKADLITLNYRGASWKSPFTWTLRITADDRLVYEYESDDAWMDEFFADDDFVDDDNAKGYLASKKKYYGEDILAGLVVITDLSPNIHAYEPSNSGSIHVVARDELMGRHALSEDEARQVVASMVNRLKARQAPVLYVPISPVQANFPLTYVPEVGSFVTVYNW